MKLFGVPLRLCIATVYAKLSVDMAAILADDSSLIWLPEAQVSKPERTKPRRMHKDSLLTYAAPVNEVGVHTS